ncbi:MAG: helix-hairpin-helix domain-containing protein [Flavobacteriales bacterium]|nr:helix-hairpin-helix domain-containing protein [Flavobacteriales bacterium]
MLKQFLEYSPSTQRGILVLFILLLGAIIWRAWPVKWRSIDVQFTYLTAIDAKKTDYSQRAENEISTGDSKQEWNLHTFDINYTKAIDFREMGFSKEFISRWFSKKGEIGFVKSYEQLVNSKICTSEELDAMRPFLDFSRYEKRNGFAPVSEQQNEPPKLQNLKININTASIDELKKLKGIGDGFANRIAKYRDKLGGYHSVGQLHEVYGLPDSVYQNLLNNVVCDGTIQTINLNIIGSAELSNHPYVSQKLAERIVNYRTQHGKFNSKEELLKVYGIDKVWLDKMSPYLTL